MPACVAQSAAKGLLMLARCRLREILRFALDDGAVVRTTTMPGCVAQSAAKGLLMLAWCQLQAFQKYNISLKIMILSSIHAHY